MPSLKGRVENGKCFIAVHISPPQSKIESIEPIATVAIIDTGAQRTCISQRIASELKLLPESKIYMASATHNVAVNQYQVGLFIPIKRLIQVPTAEGKVNYETHLSLFGSPKTVVMEFKTNDQFDVLIGMDMLAGCTFFVAHGEFYLSY